MAYTPRVFTKNVWDESSQTFVLQTRTADTIVEDVELRFDGWTPGAALPPPGVPELFTLEQQGALNTSFAPVSTEATIETGRLSETSLSATYARHQGPVNAGVFAAPAEKLLSETSTTLALAGDSTGDESAEWWETLWNKWAATRPVWTVLIKRWNDGTQVYDNVPIQTGYRKSCTSADAFERTSAELVGSSGPRGGAAWSGQTGNFSVSSGSCNWVASGGGFNALPGTVATAKKIASGTVTIDTSNTGVARTIHLGTYTTGTNVERLALRLKIDASGNRQIGIDGQFPTFATVTADTTKNNIPAGAATVLAWSLSIDGTAVIATVGTESLTGTLTAPQQTSVAAMNGCYLLSTGTLTGLKINDIMLTSYDGSNVPTLTILNGSRAGSDLTYQQSRISTMFPAGTIDALFVSSSHNYGSQSPATYQTAVAAFLTAYDAAHPESAVVLVAQNPQAAPASNRVAHRARVASLPAYAKANGYGCIDFLTAFETYPDWQRWLIRADGVHPTSVNAFDELTDPVNGSYVLRNAARRWIDAAPAETIVDALTSTDEAMTALLVDPSSDAAVALSTTIGTQTSTDGVKRVMRSAADGLTGRREWEHQGTVGYLDHLIAGPGSAAGTYLVGMGTDWGSAGGLLISAKNPGEALALQLNPSHTGYGLLIQGHAKTKPPLRIERSVGGQPIQFVNVDVEGFADGVTTSGSATFTSATAVFSAGDVGRTITQVTSRGEGIVIQAATTIATFVNATTVTLSSTATGSATGINFTITGRANSGSPAVMQFYASGSSTPYVAIRPFSVQILTALEVINSGTNPNKQYGTGTEQRFYQYNAGGGNYHAHYIQGNGSTLRFRHYDPAAQGSEAVSADVLTLGKAGIGFYGTAPVAKQTLAAAATDAATTQALVNDIRAKLIATGLMA